MYRLDVLVIPEELPRVILGSFGGTEGSIVGLGSVSVTSKEFIEEFQGIQRCTRCP